MLSRATLLTSVGTRHCDFRTSSVMAMATGASPWPTSFTQNGVLASRGSSSSLTAYPCLSSRTHVRWCPPSRLPLRPHAQRLNMRNFSGASRLPLTVAQAIVQEEQQAKIGLKTFLEELKAVGRVRLIVNTGVAVLESVTSLNNLFYHTLPGRGEYANLMLKEDNVDFHLLIDQVASAKLVTGKSSRGDIPTYMVRFVDNNESVAVSLLVMWKPGTDGEYDNGQVDAFQQLLDKFGPEVTFSPNESTSSMES